MRNTRGSRAALAALSLAALVLARSAAAGDAVEAVRGLEAERQRAMVAADRPALERLLSPDCTYTHSTGLVQSRGDLIAMIEAKGVRYRSLTTERETYRDFGETVVVTGTQAIELEVRGQPLVSNSRFTVVWARVDGAWTCVAYQSTPVPEAKE